MKTLQKLVPNSSKVYDSSPALFSHLLCAIHLLDIPPDHLFERPTQNTMILRLIRPVPVAILSPE